MLFPRQWVPFAERKKSGNVLPTVLAQEAQWAQKANEEREQARQELLEKPGTKPRGKIVFFMNDEDAFWREPPGRNMKI